MLETSKRARCSTCYYPVATCVCLLVPEVNVDLEVWILQDPLEAKHAKNTARLFALSYQNAHIISIANPQEMAQFYRRVKPSNALLLYPDERAIPIERIETETVNLVEHLILLDATWPKAKKMWCLNIQLQHFQTVCFESPPHSCYDIRKSPSSKALSTLEAAVYGVESIRKLQLSEIRQYFKNVLELQWSKQPLAHRQSYSEEGNG